MPSTIGFNGMCRPPTEFTWRPRSRSCTTTRSYSCLGVNGKVPTRQPRGFVPPADAAATNLALARHSAGRPTVAASSCASSGSPFQDEPICEKRCSVELRLPLCTSLPTKGLQLRQVRRPRTTAPNHLEMRERSASTSRRSLGLAEANLLLMSSARPINGRDIPCTSATRRPAHTLS